MRSSSCEPNCLRCARARHVARQFLELIVADADAEILPRDVFDLVRLVEDHGAVIGNDAAPRLDRPPFTARSAKNRW